MNHKFDWKSVPDSSKLREQDAMESFFSDNKFFFADEEGLNKTFNIDSIDISLDDINSLNIVINDNECSNNLIEAICQQLDHNGIKYTFTGQEKNFDDESNVIITLDQQYVSGPRVSIIGSYDNNRNDNSDALALAMDTAFRARGVDSDGVFCGRRGYRKTEHDVVRTRIPTPTEDAVHVDSNTSFVTIAFGTSMPTAEVIASVIVEGLGRYVAYVSEKRYSDLIYRAEFSDDLDSLAARFGSTAFDVGNLNNIDITIPSDEAIINPVGYNSVAFDKNIPVKISESHLNKSFK